MEPAYLEFTRDGRKQRVALDGNRLTLGRAADNDLVFSSDGTVSGRHAILERQEDGWTVLDLRSSNGTYVNGRRIGESALLRPGDTVTIGKARLTFRIPQTLPSPPDAAEPAGYLAATEWAVARPEVQGKPEVQAKPEAQAKPEVLAARQIRHGGSEVIRGIARQVQTRHRHNDYSVLSFRVERYDALGNRQPPVAVEFIGYKRGQLGDGDQVEVAGGWKSGTLRATSVINLSTNAVVHGPSVAIKAGRGLFIVVFVMIWLIIIGAFLASVL